MLASTVAILPPSSGRRRPRLRSLFLRRIIFPFSLNGGALVTPPERARREKPTTTTKTDRTTPDSRKVIVIGAGAAGLACAHALRKRGVDALVLEASARAGGRMAGEESDGFHISTGAQFFDSTYRTAFGLAGDLGVSTGSLRLSGSISQYARKGPRRVAYANLLSMRLYSPKALGQAARLMARLVRRKGDISAPDYARLLDVDNGGESFADYGAKADAPDNLVYFNEPGGEGSVFYPGLLSPSAISFAWGAAPNLYVVQGRTDATPPDLIWINTRREGSR